MASELTVQTIKGPTSGGNANKIIVPAGQTLTAPGHVIQGVTNTFSGSSTSSSSYAAMATCGSITTKVANSKLLVTASAQCQVGRSTSQDGRGNFQLRSSTDSYSASLHTQVVVNYRESSNGWNQPVVPFHLIHSPSVSAGTTVTYKIYGRVAATNPGTYVIDAWGEGAIGQLTILEIAP